jgi:Plasmid pRiA4b ORF-3-like protein
MKRLIDLIGEAVALGADALEIDGQEGRVRASAMRGPVGFGIGSVKSNSKESEQLFAEIMVLKKAGRVVFNGQGHRVKVSEFDSFGETAYRIEIRGAATVGRTTGIKGEPLPKTQVAASKSIYQLKVTLLETEPPIWRRVLVDGSATLAKLATIINAAMGWEGYHLHEFRVGKEVWGPPSEFGDDFGGGPKDHRRTTLARVAPRKRSSLKYQYDGGDCWMHHVVVEDVLAPAAKQRYPVCLEGERACPPEDCGGISGFYHLLEALADEEHPDHGHFTDWIDGEFDPLAFDLEAVNKALRESS